MVGKAFLEGGNKRGLLKIKIGGFANGCFEGFRECY